MGAMLTIPSADRVVTIPSRIMTDTEPVRCGIGLQSCLQRPTGLESYPTGLELAQGAQQAFGFLPRLLVFALGLRVGHNAAADRELEPAAAVRARADQDVRVHRSVDRDVAQTRAVRSARGRLKLGDDLHGADLGRPGDRSA